ncbi:hypothetical protein AAFF27_11015 [Xylophilus sp. GW821-FHT01B05]
MPEFIIEELAVSEGSVRSISLERDLYEKTALQRYLVTPSVVTALNQLGRALVSDSPQRAWRVVGPYGSGKSALGVAVGQLCAGPGHFASISTALKAQSPATHDLFKKLNRFPVALVGSRLSLGVALGRALQQGLERWQENKSAKKFQQRLNLTNGQYDGIPLNAAVSQMVHDFADAANESGFHGLLIMVDELGKFVEHAALFPAEGDIMALQQLAESACGSGDMRLSVVTFLHQHMSAYADGLGKTLSDDWEKVASRFEEIPFDEPIERYARFAAHALGVSAKLKKNATLVSKARALFKDSLQSGLLKAHSADEKQLFAAAEQLYPLHPTVIASMAMVAKRMGQSERSFHAFLNGNEPFGLRDFAGRTKATPDSWYRLDSLWDHLASSNSLRFRERNAERRWLFAKSCIAREHADSLKTKVLKVVAVGELVERHLRIQTSLTFIQEALDDIPASAIAQAVSELVKAEVLQSRRDGAQIATAVPELANIDALFEEASREKEATLITRALSTALASRPVVANRHYDTTGTLRTLAILVGSTDGWPDTPKLNPDGGNPDGWLKVVIVGPTSRELKQATDQCKQQSDPLELSVCLQPDIAARQALAQYAIWLAVSLKLKTKQLDPWANEYVERQLATMRDAVDLVTSQLLTNQLNQEGASNFWRKGQKVPAKAARNLSQLASWLFDEQFPEAPKLVNELINKERPASAIVLARQRMFDVFLSGNPEQQICGPKEFPPERLIHQTLLVESGMWQVNDGRWKLVAPKPGAAVDVSPLWATITEALGRGPSLYFSDLIEILAAPPLGVRAGPAGIWAALYLLINRGTCAVFERGSLILEMTAEHLHRLFKAPHLFELREMTASEVNRALLDDYVAALATVGVRVDGEATVLEITRAVYRWISRLPNFTIETSTLGKDTVLFRTHIQRSRDHIDLLLRALPNVHKESKSKQSYREWVAAALADLGGCYRRLQDEVATILGTSFEIAGTLPRVRQQLQKECSSASADLAESNLRAFVLRCADITLPDERWLDSLASLIVHKPLDAWVDSTITQFEMAVIDLCGQYKRWAKLVSHRVRNPVMGERYVSVTMTLPSGHEEAVFVVADPAAKRMAEELLSMLEAKQTGSREQMLAALGQALLTLQASTHSSSEENIDVQQKAS